MNESMFSLNITFEKGIQCSEWVRNDSKTYPVSGLFDYGFEITDNGKIILFGGVTNNSPMPRRSTDYKMYSSLWIWNLTDSSPHFQEFILAEGGAGYSKIVSLGGEIICLLNDLLPNKMILINVDQLLTSPMKILNAPVTNRTAFAVASLNETAFVLMGGYSTDGDLVQELDKDTFISTYKYNRIRTQHTDEEFSG